MLGAPATATVTIADDDPPGVIDFKSLRYDVDETDGQAIVTVERLGGVGGAVSVDYETSDGSATAGADYTTRSGTLNWAAGDGNDKTFTVPVTWDGRAEGTESISLALTNPDGGADQGPNSAAVIRIGDDGASGPLALSAGAYQVGEAGGLVTITATRAGGSLGGPVSVDYATSDGTATAGSDYDAAAGTLTFGPGEASKSFTVHVTSDTAHEGDEAFQVKLSNAAGGASLGSPAGATVTITDDDAAPGASDAPARRPAPPAARRLRLAAESPVPVMSDRTAPKLTLAAKATQRALKAKRLALSARCNERCKLVAVAKLRIGKRTVTLGRVKATVLTSKTAQAQGQALEEGAGQAAQGDETRKGQGRALRPCHGRRRQPDGRVPQGRRQALVAIRRGGSGAARCPSRAPRRRSRRASSTAISSGKFIVSGAAISAKSAASGSTTATLTTPSSSTASVPPRTPTITPSSTNGQRMNQSVAPTSFMTSTSRRRA